MQMPSSSFDSISTCITFEELFGKRATIESFRKFLSQFQREKVVLATCIVNAFLDSWTGSIDADGHDALVQGAFLPEDAQKLLQACKSSTPSRYVFHRQQVLLIAKEATLHCKDEGVDPLQTPHWAGLGLAFLMASDLMDTVASDSRKNAPENFLKLLGDSILVGEFSGRYFLGNRVARSYLMLIRFFPTVAKDQLDIPKAFRKITGFDLQTFMAVCIAILTFYLTHTFAKLRTSPGVLLNDEFWSKVQLDKATLDNCLNELAGTLDQIRAKFLERDKGLFDMTGFRTYPLVRHSTGGTYAPDLQLLSQKLESGVFWKVHDSLSNKDLIHQLWGQTFEKYVNWLIVEMVDDKINKFIPSPRFKKTGDQVCDGIIVCGHRIIFLEYKGRTFRADAKYSGDFEILRKEIHTHLVGTAEKPKGVYQLSNAIKKVFDPKDPMEIEGLDLEGISKVFPVLLTRDDLGGTFGLCHYLNGELERLLYKRPYRPITITPLFALSIEGLELISGYLKETALSAALESWYERDKGLYSSFTTELGFFTERLGDRRNLKLWSQFQELMDDAAHTLFDPKAVDQTSHV